MHSNSSSSIINSRSSLCRLVALLLAGLSCLAALSQAQAAGAGIDVCGQADCGCRLPSVRSEGRSFTKTVGTRMCVCLCGSEIAESCKTDGQCVSGAYCRFEYSTADASFSAEGKCISNCNKQQCPQFHQCSVNTAGEAVCECSKYPCDHSVVVPICAAAADDRKILTFNNTCLFVNENCERRQKGLGELKSFVCMTS